LEYLLHLLSADKKLYHLNLLSGCETLVHDLFVIFIKPYALVLILNVLELHTNGGAVHFFKIFFGLLDGADLICQSLRDTIVQGIASDGLKLIELPVI
jgi:hypothetical protein